MNPRCSFPWDCHHSAVRTLAPAGTDPAPSDPGNRPADPAKPAVDPTVEAVTKGGFYMKVRNLTDTWAAANAPQLLRNPVAYFSAEFGFHETLPIAASLALAFVLIPNVRWWMRLALPAEAQDYPAQLAFLRRARLEHTLRNMRSRSRRAAAGRRWCRSDRPSPCAGRSPGRRG